MVGFEAKGCYFQQLPSWVEKGQKANLSQAHLNERSFWVPSTTTILPTLNGPSWQGGHGKICKM